MNVAVSAQEDIEHLRRLRWVSWLEGSTLVALVFVAVPLKHVGGLPAAVNWIGPIHGFAFCLYIWMLIQTLAGGDWTRGEVLRAVVAALIPFGGFVNERALRRKQAALESAPA